jgi:hypothetical protein
MFTTLTMCVLALLAGGVVDCKQHYAIRGKLMCGLKPYANAQVLLYDEDTGSPDDDMQSGKTDNDGYFSLEGEASDPLGDIDPRLRIYDGCNKDLTQVGVPLV